MAASVSLGMKQSISGFCDLHTTDDGRTLLTDRGEAVSIVRVLGVRRVLAEGDGKGRDGEVAFHAEGMRGQLAGMLDQPGHALQWWFGSDPELAPAEIKRNAEDARAIARQIGLDLDLIFDERERVLAEMMRWEGCYLAIWTRRAALNREEHAHIQRKQAQAMAGQPLVEDAQSPFISTRLVTNKHAAFAGRVTEALETQGIGHEVLDARAMIVAARESAEPASVGSGWMPRLLGDPMWPREPNDMTEGTADATLPPTIRDQIFSGIKCMEVDHRTVQVGDHLWGNVDMEVGPENPRPFAELVAALATSRIPWRISILMEGGGDHAFSFKRTVAGVIGFGGNKKIYRAMEDAGKMRAENVDISVRFRVSCATWAPASDPERLKLNRATLEQKVAAWGNIKTADIAGDPLAGVMSSALGMAVASTAPAHQAPLFDALKMAPWGRPGSPYTSGSVMYRTPDGRMWPMDPAGSGRQRVLNLRSGPSRHGKSMGANTDLLGLCVSGASQGPDGTRLPLIGKIDIGRSAEGLVRMLQEALPDDRKHEALYVPLRFIPEHAANILDTQVGCRFPLELERAFQINMISLATTPLDEKPFEAMDQLIAIVLDEAYRMQGTDGPNRRTKPYVRGRDPVVDGAIERYGIELRPDAWWWDVVDALCDEGAYRSAEFAQRHAVPTLEDLISASRTTQVEQLFRKVQPRAPESVIEMFSRYLQAFIRRYPTFNMPTRIDFPDARVIVIDLDAVAPTGSADADRQTALVYMLARHMIARNFFLRPEYVSAVPERVAAYHEARFRHIYETVKVLSLDEYQRTKKQAQVRDQIDRDGREGAKHNVMLDAASQRGQDFSEYLLSQATGYWIHGVGGADEAEELARILNLSDNTARIVARRLTGPASDGSGAPFVLVMTVNGVTYEQMLVNSVGPAELWALSTTPEDVALRTRLYETFTVGEALRRLAIVFPTGTAIKDIRHRKEVRMRKGVDDAAAQAGVVDEIARELYAGVGLGIQLREAA